MQDELLKEYVDDLNSIKADEGHTDTQKYKNVRSNLKGLLKYSQKYYEEGAEGLNKPQLFELIKEYEKLYSACNDYLKDKGTSRRSGFGQGRLEVIKQLREVIVSDMDELIRVYRTMARDAQTSPLRDLIKGGRITEAELEGTDKLLDLGHSSSSRVPIKLTTEYGETEGFFTDEGYVQSNPQIARNMYDKYRKRNGLEYIMNYAAVNPVDFVRQTAICHETLFNKNVMPELITMDNDGIFEYIWNSKENMDKFKECFRGFFNSMRNNLLLELDGERQEALFHDKEKFRNFLSMVIETSRKAIMAQNMLMQAGVKPGQEISKRNIFMSRVSTLVGRSDLVAGARFVDLKIDGKVKEGVFVEKAKGSDINRVKFHLFKKDEKLETIEDLDPMEFLSVYDIKRSSKLMMDLADLQVVDYLSGNPDRHMANMTFNVGWADKARGKAVIGNLTGFDNDLCGGVSDDWDMAKYHFCMPEQMGVIRRKTAEKIMSITPDIVRIHCSDLGMTKAEMDAMVARLNNLKHQLKNGVIRILEDKEFEKKGLYDSIVSSQPRGSKNYFVQALGIPDYIKQIRAVWLKTQQNSIKTETEIRYATARVTEKLPPQNRGRINISSLLPEAEKLRGLLKRLDAWKADSIFHRNTGSFRWMKESAQALRDRLNSLSSKYSGQKGEITEAESKELDRLYRQVYKASRAYQLSHLNASSTMGVERRDVARELNALRCPRPLIADVNELSFNSLLEENIDTGTRSKEKHERKGSEKGEIKTAINRNSSGADPQSEDDNRIETIPVQKTGNNTGLLIK